MISPNADNEVVHPAIFLAVVWNVWAFLPGMADYPTNFLAEASMGFDLGALKGIILEEWEDWGVLHVLYDLKVVTSPSSPAVHNLLYEMKWPLRFFHSLS